MTDSLSLSPPLPLVTQHVPKSPANGKALDLGCGDGHNSIFLAEQGYCVDAVDACVLGTMVHDPETFLLDLPSFAKKKKLPVTTHSQFLELFVNACPPETYDVVLAVYVLFFFQGDNATLLYDDMLPRIVRILKPGGRFVCAMLRSKKEKASGEELIPPETLSLLEPSRLEGLFPQNLNIVSYNPARISDIAPDGNPGEFEYCHWELVADKVAN